MALEQNKQPIMGISPNCLTGPEEVDFARLCVALGATGLEDCRDVLPHFTTEIDAVNQHGTCAPSADDKAA